MHQTKYRGIITEGRIIDVSSLGASGFPLVKPLRKSVNPFGGDLCFGWKPFKIIHADPLSRNLAVSKIKEAQETYSLESR